MKKIFKASFAIMFVLFLAIGAVACGQQKCSVAEKVSLTSAVLGEVEFSNADTVTLSQDCENVTIGGTIQKMSTSQTNAFGDPNVTHSVVLKFEFDKERTLSSFEIKGSKTKVFATDSSVENYSGSLTDLLDSGAGEDAYTNLVLSAQTKSYTLTTKYTDNTESVINVKINATLANA